MTPQSVGALETSLVLGKHSGRHAVKGHLRKMGHTLNDEEVNKVTRLFKERCNTRKDISADDLEDILYRDVLQMEDICTLVHLSVCTADALLPPRAVVKMTVHGELCEEISDAGSPVEAAFAAIGRITGADAPLLEYEGRAVMDGGGLSGEASVRLQSEGRTVLGRGVHPDLVVASARAYIHALNLLAWIRGERMKKKE
jgi:2-isopropylmalate synthase